MADIPTSPVDDAAPPTLLFVDDEPNMLSALRRLFRPQGYRILTAGSAAEGLALLEKEAVDLVISDMRMPEMDGAHFLEIVRARWPDTVRILLTGYADVASTIAAINKGEIYRYISKPWEDNDILLLVRHALERQRLEQEKRRLEALTARQNEELRELNASLEAKVQERTQDLRRTMATLEKAHEQLKKSFITSVRIFSNLLELRAGGMAGHSRRVADLARAIALRMGLKDSELQDLVFAAMLHDTGKIGLPDYLLGKPFNTLDKDEREQVMKHPVTGQHALLALDRLRNAALLVRHHHERFDGQGYPDHLAGFAIPLGARILAVANDYDSLQCGTLVQQRLTPAKAHGLIVEGRGKRYDPAVVDAFIEVQAQMGQTPPPERELSSAQLSAGMVLSRDLLARDGMLLLSRDYVLDAALIEQMRQYERLEGYRLNFWIKTE